MVSPEGCLHVPYPPVFHDKYKVEAAHRVIDSGRTIAEVPRELRVNEGAAQSTLGTSVRWCPILR